jgi:tetratricopeptide (TPR) repeat protein
MSTRMNARSTHWRSCIAAPLLGLEAACGFLLPCFGQENSPMGELKSAPPRGFVAGEQKNVSRAYRCYLNALQAYYKSDFDGVISECERALLADDGYPDAIVLKGTALVGLGKLDLALADFERVLITNPKSAFALRCRGRVYFLMNKLPEAIADFSSVIKLEPTGDDFFCRARAYYAAGKFGESIKDYESSNEALGGTRMIISYAKVLSSCPYADSRNGQKALKMAKGMCEYTNYRDSDALDALATAYAENGDFDAAVEYEKKALDLSPTLYLKCKLSLFEKHEPYRDKP